MASIVSNGASQFPSLDMETCRLDRRQLLAALPLLIAFPTGVNATQQAGVDGAAFEALGQYCGVYRLSNSRAIGINRFITDGGRGVLFFADYSTSLVRPLFQVDVDRFAMGPPGGGETPVLLALNFKRDSQGSVCSVIRKGPAGIQDEARRSAGSDEEVRFTQGGASLAGTLALPSGTGPHPAIILLHGSGPLTRHSFGPYPRFFASLGFAVLTYDKRGTGASNGRRLDASTGAPETLSPSYYPDDLLADARAAHRYLSGRPEIDRGRIGFWGSSEGGMLATQAAAAEPSTAFAINSSGFMGPLWETLYYQGGALMRSRGASEADIAEADTFNSFWMNVARTGHGYDEFIRRRAELLRAGKASSLYYVSDEYRSLAQMRWSWRHILAFDSTKALRMVRCPVLGIFGEADVLTDAKQASAAMRRALTAGGDKQLTTRIIPNATHSLMATNREGMAPGVFDLLTRWLEENARSAPQILTNSQSDR
ncbi:alpha/beta hydrolase [Sphingomonas cannabina]|uniref:alpha/beta hydrolase family protein n=1 Tax=Sphingomonas cannabina TaxID=2899123 RepID=UPI001F28E0D0|nr:alpha/beta hydrolase [Sphingomonas cannabina]UIJ44919.1 alpha/beta hydrolase [Sphingomonas cannabina]